MSPDPSIGRHHDTGGPSTPQYDRTQLTSALELLRRRISDLRDDADEVDALLQLLALVKRQTTALHVHAQVLQAANGPEPARDRETEVAPTSHLLFLPGAAAYALVERDGAAPAAGTLVTVDGRELSITKVARSPLPRDHRDCAYAIEPAYSLE